MNCSIKNKTEFNSFKQLLQINKKNILYNQNKMFSIKIAYKGKNILLGKGIDSLKKIDQELTTRFPGQFLYGAILKYQGNTITQFQQIQAIVVNTASKSLKLEAEQAQPKKLSEIKEEKPSQEVSANQNNEVNQQKKNIQLQAQKNIQEIKNEQVKVQQPVKEEKQQQPLIQQKKQQNIQKPQQKQVQQQVRPKIIEIDESLQVSVKQAPKEVQVQTQFKTQIIPNDVKQIDPAQVKCKIYNQAPQQAQEPINDGPKQEQYVPTYTKCSMFGQAPSQVLVKQQEVEYKDTLKQIQPGVYECIFCQTFSSCNVCHRKRRLDQNSSFIKIVNNLVDKKINQLERKMTEKFSKLLQLEESKLEKKIEIKQTQSRILQQEKLQEQQKNLIKSNPCQVEDLAWNKKQVSVGQNFNWTFRIKFKNPLKKTITACLLDEKNGEIKKIHLTSQNLISVGPFVAPSQAKFERTYRLCILEQDQSLQLFGPKFGFNVIIAKPQMKKVLSNGFRIHIEQIKRSYKIEKSIEYLVQRLKQLGINQQNYQESKDLLADILQTV